MRFFIVKRVSIWLLLLLLSSGIIWAADNDSTTVPNDTQTHFFGFPILSESPETGIAGGGYLMLYRNSNSTVPNGNLDSLNGVLIFTEKEQLITSLSVKKYFRDDRFLLTADCGYVDFPSKFYGIGPKTDEDLEESYTLISKSFRGNFLWRLSPKIYLGPILAYYRFGIEDCEENGLLTTENIAGFDGATVAGGGLKLLWDTRDDGFLPRHGFLWETQLLDYPRSWGSDNDFSQLTTSYRQFFPIGQTGTMALMSVLTLSDGDVPFEMMPCLGGPIIMRGYYEGRYRDRNYGAIQGEYRFPIAQRFSGVAFGSLGEVTNEIDQFNLKDIKVAGGVGLRFRIDPNQKINLRFDIGLSEDGFFGYINFMEAF